jgi:SAM-dependent methyltransferase
MTLLPSTRSNSTGGTSRRGGIHFASHYRWLIIRDWLRVAPTDRLLDVGCDDGEIVARLKATERVALDLNPRCPDPDVRLMCADARRLPVPTGEFDTVLAFDIIEHIEDDRAVLAELVRAMTGQGTLWLSTPAADFRIFPAFLTPRANRGFGHVRNGYTLDDLRGRLPANVRIEMRYWNEPVFRFSFAALRVLDAISGTLARQLAGLCFRVDRHFQSGTRGHLLARITLPADPASVSPP